MEKVYESLCQTLEKEIKTIEQQNAPLTKESLELLKCITETLSNIKMIMKAQEEKTLNENDLMSYDNMRSNAQRRDSMGRYMDYNPRYVMSNMAMDADYSYKRGNSNNSYENSNMRNSRDYNSYSRDDSRKKMVRKLETLMDDTMSDKERQAIQDCINRIDQ